MNCSSTNTTQLPNGQCSFLPILPVDGQIFIDKEYVKWVYNSVTDYWEKSGTVATIPLATSTTTGYMSYADKKLLDSIPAAPGGFGIITDSKLLLKSDDNPDGVIKGDIQLKSESLDIVCVGTDGLKSECVTYSNLECATSIETIPGLSFKLSDKFLRTLTVNLAGPRGKKGHKGNKGTTGKPGFVGGPVGRPGQPGENIDSLNKLSGIRYNDVEGVSDSAIVEMSALDQGTGCQLLLKKAKLNIPGNVPAEKVIANPLNRYLVYNPDKEESTCSITRLKDWKLAKDPDDKTPINVNLLRLSTGAEDVTTEPVGINSSLTLYQFVDQVVNEYIEKLKIVDEEYGKVAKEYIESIDDSARTILSELANDLTMCEFNMPAVEYGMTFRGCDQPPSPSPVAANSISHYVATANTKMADVKLGVKRWDIKQ